MHRILCASALGAKLDSNVYLGGGTDDTDILQAALDTADEHGLTLILDGAALVRGLSVRSNTTLLCPNPSCGLFLAEGANTSLVHNAHPDHAMIHDANIVLIGGTYNHNYPGQAHDIRDAQGHEHYTIGFEFYGVEGLTIRDLTLIDQRTFGFLISNWRHVVMENITICLKHHVNDQNQDGIHFWGPGRFLTIRNVSGSAGDDFLAIAPDENDGISSIEDVCIDGVHLEDADQGIRLLSRGTGRLDRVCIQNVTGTYRSFGFYITPWFHGATGNYGHIRISNVSLVPEAPNYTYTAPHLFYIGGPIEDLEISDVYWRANEFDRPIFRIARPAVCDWHGGYRPSVIDRIHIRNLTAKFPQPSEYALIEIENHSRVRHLQLENINLFEETAPAIPVVRIWEDARIENLSIQGGSLPPGREWIAPASPTAHGLN